ncbi:MAG: hypothetical protein D3903_22440, partial [Candidatus Electrothrix sp. GM3_4]|nr:hypothetical protein [Candidatus Electrothrix sp. GM3_4]
MRQENDTKERLIKELQKYSNSISNYNDQLKQQIEVFEKRKIERNKKNIGNTEHIDNTQALLKKYNSFFAKYHKYQQHKQSRRETAQDVIEQKKAMLENLKTALHELENLLYASVGEYEQTILISHLRQRKLLKNQLRKLNNEINQSMLYVKQMLKLEEENLKFNYSISRLQEIKYNYRVNTGSNLESMPNFP